MSRLLKSDWKICLAKDRIGVRFALKFRGCEGEKIGIHSVSRSCAGAFKTGFAIDKTMMREPTQRLVHCGMTYLYAIGTHFNIDRRCISVGIDTLKMIGNQQLFNRTPYSD